MTFQYNGININITKQGNGEPVFLLHGWGCTGEIFKHINDVLSTAYTTYSFDFPGFGASQEPTSVWGVEEYTCMVEQFAKTHGIERPALMGHSFFFLLFLYLFLVFLSILKSSLRRRYGHRLWRRALFAFLT